MSTRRSGSRRSGIATVAAVFMISLLAVVLAILSSSFNDAVKRTRSLKRQAQMRQLLIAGAASVSARVSAWKQSQRSVWAIDPLETPHGRATVSIEVAPHPDSDRLEARIRVGLDADRASQTLRFVRTPGGYTPDEARLEP